MIISMFIRLFSESVSSGTQSVTSDILLNAFWIIVILSLILFPLLSKRNLKDTIANALDTADSRMDKINEKIEPKINNFTDKIKKNKKFLILVFIIIIGFSGIIISPHIQFCDNCKKMISADNAYPTYDPRYCENCYTFLTTNEQSE